MIPPPPYLAVRRKRLHTLLILQLYPPTHTQINITDLPHPSYPLTHTHSRPKSQLGFTWTLLDFSLYLAVVLSYLSCVLYCTAGIRRVNISSNCGNEIRVCGWLSTHYFYNRLLYVFQICECYFFSSSVSLWIIMNESNIHVHSIKIHFQTLIATMYNTKIKQAALIKGS